MKRPKLAAVSPEPKPRRIRAKPWEADQINHLQNILDRLNASTKAHQFCNLSPADCDLLMGSITATVDALDSSQCVIRQVAREHYGDEAENMTTKDFADRMGYKS